MASSTTIPMASTIPKRVRVLMVKPSKSIPANVPIIEIGTAIQGISVALQFCKKRYTTKNTRSTASKSVVTTDITEAFTKSVVS